MKMKHGVDEIVSGILEEAGPVMDWGKTKRSDQRDQLFLRSINVDGDYCLFNMLLCGRQC